VLKAKLQADELAAQWSDIEASAFTYLPYATLRRHIDSLPDMNIASLLERTEDENLRSLITELTVEPIRTDGEVSDRYVASIIARLREVALSRSIAEIKSTLQRINPLEESDRYNEIFASLVAMEAQKRAQKELAIGDL